MAGGPPLEADTHRGLGYTLAVRLDRNGAFRWIIYAPEGQAFAESRIGFVTQATAFKAAEVRAAELGISLREAA
jgi:hypothetical protein